jgi:hypothetical protein
MAPAERAVLPTYLEVGQPLYDHRPGAVRDLIRDNAEFGSHRIGHFTGDQSDRYSERMPGAQAARGSVLGRNARPQSSGNKTFIAKALERL